MALKLVHHKRDVSAVLLDGAGHNEALDAEIAVVGFVAHAAEFGNGDVIALVRFGPGEGKPADGADDNGHRNPDS